MAIRTPYLDIDFQGTATSTTVTTPSIFQFDYGVRLRLSHLNGVSVKAHYTCEFMQGTLVDTATKSDKYMISQIPSLLLSQASTIHCFLYVESSAPQSGITIKHVVIPVIARPKPESVDYTPEERSAYDELEASLNAMLEQYAHVITNGEAIIETVSDATTTANEAKALAESLAGTVQTTCARADAAANKAEETIYLVEQAAIDIPFSNITNDEIDEIIEHRIQNKNVID